VAPILRAAVAVGGSVVVSGVLTDQRPAVIASATHLGLVPLGEETADGWLAVTFATRRPARSVPTPTPSSHPAASSR
jgi:ribosomal protein L11 methylase PrmA